MCCSELFDSKDRYLVTGRSAFNIVEAIQNLPFPVRYNSDSYVCRKCLGLLNKKRNFEHNYDKCLKELQDVVQRKAFSHPEPVSTRTPVKATPTKATQNEKLPVTVGTKSDSQTTATVSFVVGYKSLL